MRRHARFQSYIVPIVAALAIAAPLAGTAAASTDALDFRNTMRKLWEDHITWTRLYIVSAAASLPDADETAARLIQNQSDIGDAIKPYYGNDAGDKLTALLKDHIQGAVEVLSAAKAGDQSALDSAKTKWYANGDEIATFLSSANPSNWPPDTMKAEMKKHLDVTLTEATARLKGDAAADVAAYDAVHEHILHLADTLSSGILAQHPEQFDQARAAKFPEVASMRKLWEDHVQWTRYYIVDASAGLPSKDAAARLLGNQVDIGDAIKPIFGADAGNQLTALLKDHITGAVDVLAAAKAGDEAALGAAKERWYANADEIATFLSNANPTSWPADTMKSEMRRHLDLTLEEATHHLKGEAASDIQTYDAVHEHILHLADTLTAGAASHAAQAGSAGQMPAALPRTGGGPEPIPDRFIALTLAALAAWLGLLPRRSAQVATA